MAGIGFELKKMFAKKGLFSMIKAYGYAGIVCVGPMILGIALLLGIQLLAGMGGAAEEEKELLNCMVSYTLLASLVLTNIFAMVTTRFVADQLYMEKRKMILPSYWGSVSLMLVVGGIGYGVFLLFAGIPFTYQLLCLMLFGELILVWSAMNYLTAIKDYRGILAAFAASLVISWLCGIIFLTVGMEPVAALLLAVVMGYGVLAVLYYYLLRAYFPSGNSSAGSFLAWIDKYPQLILLGLFLSAGLFGHLVIMWGSTIRRQAVGLFYSAPMYDIPALLAFLSILITTISFVTTVEVNFYPKYRNYFSLFNDGGSLMDMKQAEKEMKNTLSQELTYTFTKQFFATIAFIIGGTLALPYLPLGMNEDMLGIFRVLCVGYALYAVGNCVMLLQLYFADNTGALISATAFMLVSCIGTLITTRLDARYYGFGFLAGAVAFALVSLWGLERYLNKLMYHVLCNQPIVLEEKSGFFTELSEKLAKRYQKKYERLSFLKENEEESEGEES